MRLLIVEDEPLVRQRLLRLCGELVGPGVHCQAVAELAEAQERLRTGGCDGLLLDLNLAGEDGFHLLRQAVAGAFHTVVVSAHAERALQAFELGVLDFVPKPFSRERLQQALQRLLGQAEGARRSLRQLAVWRARGVALVELSEVLCFRADGEASELRLIDGRVELHAKSLERLTALLPGEFLRCHRSWIVNLKQARRLHVASGSRYTLELSDGSELPVGRTQVEALRARLL